MPSKYGFPQWIFLETRRNALFLYGKDVLHEGSSEMQIMIKLNVCF